MQRIAEAWAESLEIEFDMWLGSGYYGEAYTTGDDRVIKITRDKDEFLCACKTLNRDADHLVKVHAVEIIDDNTFAILMDKVDTDAGEDIFYELISLSEDQCVNIVDIDPEEEGVDLSDEAYMMLNHIQIASMEANQLGFMVCDIHAENIGLNTEGRYVLFDQRQNLPKSLIDYEFEVYKSSIPMNLDLMMKKRRVDSPSMEF